MDSELYIGIFFLFIGFFLFVIFFIFRFLVNLSLYYFLNAIFYNIDPIKVNYSFDDDCSYNEKCYNGNLLIYSIIFFLNFLLISYGLALVFKKKMIIN